MRCIVLCRAVVLYSAALCCAVPCCPVLCCVVVYRTMPRCAVVQCYTVLPCVMLYYACTVVRSSVALCWVELYCNSAFCCALVKYCAALFLWSSVML
jgi:hypothetical protein